MERQENKICTLLSYMQKNKSLRCIIIVVITISFNVCWLFMFRHCDLFHRSAPAAT